jgi:predicted PurR-regulated permease PerM
MTDSNRPAVPPGLARVAVATWAIIGVVIVLCITFGVLAAVSELVLPLIFAVMLGAVSYPLATRLRRHGAKPALASALVVVGLVVVGAGVALMTVKAIVQQTGELADQIDRALAELATSTDSAGLSAHTLTAVRDAITELAGFIGRGLLTAVVGGVSALVGFVGSLILSLLIMYYVVKDGPDIRDRLVRQMPDRLQAETRSFISDAVGAIRGYWAGRSVLSAAVTAVVVVVSLAMGLPMIATIAVVNFLGGFVPYIGAFIGGGLATLLAIADGGISKGLIMLAIVIACNVLLENLLEPRIMSGRLQIHPLLVLLATTAGGVLGGIVGLVLAVPVTVVTLDLIKRLRQHDALTVARSKVEPALRLAVSGEAAIDHEHDHNHDQENDHD